MPIKWTPELDAILLHGVFEECNISFSKALCAKIAERVTTAGMECTPKAVENRLYSWKKKNVSGNTGLNSSATNTPTKAAGTPKTPRARAKATPKKKKAADESDGPEGQLDDDDDGDEVVSPSAARGKRRKQPSYAEPESEEEEPDYIPMKKRVKTEPQDDDDNEASFDGVFTNGFGVEDEI